MTENNIIRNTDYTDSNISNIINNISIIKIKELSFQKLKTRSTSIITYSSTNEIRKDIFGEEIKKGGKQRISFADNILLKDDIINKNCENITRNKLDNFVEIIDVISYKKENKLNYYKSNSIASYDDEICCESCIIY